MVTAGQLLPLDTVVVAGLGRAGEGALTLLRRMIGPERLMAWDASIEKPSRSAARRWRRQGVTVHLGGDGLEVLELAGPAATVVRSPGIDPTVPLLRAAVDRGLTVVDELEIGWRARQGPLVAVTGTNGKSTTCALIAAIFQAGGQAAQIVGNTQFGPPLSLASKDARTICEVSSFQLQMAPGFLPEVAVFTNLTMDHLARHGTMEAYGDTKQQMFVRGSQCCGLAVVNGDDDRGARILAAVRQAGGRTLSYGVSPRADVRVLDAAWTLHDARTRLAIGDVTLDLFSRLPGRYNAMNIAAAVAVAWDAGLAPDVIAAGVANAAPPPGRCRVIDSGQPFDVVVDFAHTPDGISQFLSAAGAVARLRGTRLRTVFGAVGSPDPAKNHLSATIARSLSDQLILTTGWAPASHRILRMRELRDAAAVVGPVDIVLDRGKAIGHAIAAAAAGDIVAILGLGPLGHLIIDRRGTRLPFDDSDVAKAILERK